MDLGGPEWSPVTEGGSRRPGPLWWSWMLLGGPWLKWTSSVSIGLLSGAGGPRLSWMGPYPFWFNVNLDGLKGAGWSKTVHGPWVFQW